MKDKVDISTTIVGLVPLLLGLGTKFGLQLDVETQFIIAAIVTAFVSHFVGKPSAMSKRTREFLAKDTATVE
jgi:hypothetical protein